MKYLAHLLFLVFSTGILSVQSSPRPTMELKTKAPLGDSVLLCSGKGAKVYHRCDCYGYKNCKGDTAWVTLQQAKEEYSRKACGICYK